MSSFGWGRESHHAECLVLTKDDHWILFGVDWSDLWRSFGEGDPPGFRDVPVENRELSAAQAAAWLDENGHEWPEVLRGRSLVEVALYHRELQRTAARCQAVAVWRRNRVVPGWSRALRRP